VLVSRAKAIMTVVSGSLIYGVAHRVAPSGLSQRRRAVHEQLTAALRVEPPSCEGEQRELLTVLDDELARLPGTTEGPMVLLPRRVDP
jgi:hypothetical protein